MFSNDCSCFSSIERDVWRPSSNNLEALMEGVSAIDLRIATSEPVFIR